MKDYQKYINALKKCAKEHENDRTLTGNIIVADLCRDTANLLKTLEQEPLLDKIKAEIRGMHRVILKGTSEDDWAVKWNQCLDEVLQIIDKVESEGEK